MQKKSQKKSFLLWATILCCCLFASLGIAITSAYLAPVETFAIEAQEPAILDGVYQISSAEELSWFATNTDGTASAILLDSIEIPADITLPLFSGGFSGTFDGNDKTITYHITAATAIHQGLFNTVSAEGTVKNVTVNGTISVTGSRSGRNYHGGIAGENNGTIANCQSNIAFSIAGTASGTNNVKYVGGIAGKNTGVITGCTNNGDITITTYAAGIAGENNGGSIFHCTNNGTITTSNTSGYAGGIVGAVTANASDNQMTISGCKNTGAIISAASDYSYAAGIIAQENVSSSYNSYNGKPSLTISNCANTGTLSAGTTNDILAKESGNCTITIETGPVAGSEEVVAAKEGLTITPTVIKAAQNIPLPTTYLDTEVAITWTSSQPQIIATTYTGYGSVTLPAAGKITVTLTATITKEDASDTKEFNIEVWSLEAVAEEQANDQVYVENAKASLENSWYKLTPVSGQDTNIVTVLKAALAQQGYDQVAVTLAHVENPADNTAAIADNGDITYFYADPSGFRGMWFASIPTTFTFHKGEAATTYETRAIIYWDRAKVEEYLETEIVPALSVPAQTTENLALPKYIGGKYGKTWVEINWESSNTKALAISEENQWQDADARYNPYVGKVFRSDADAEVTLTATLTFHRTNDSNGGNEQKIAITKTFPTTVLAMDDATLAAIKAEMQQALDNGYDTGFIKDYVTQEQADLANVTNDLQLLIPKQTGIANYWDYQFTVISNNKNVIETPEVANAARAFVYRPLPGENAAEVTLTVIMTSRENPNLSVGKDIAITVQPLTQAEIDAALTFMEVAKEQYFQALNKDGQYPDAYTVTGSLSPFQEGVWNTEENDILWIYDQKEVKRNGIIADELDNWAEQEDWRAFRSSNAKIINNETLYYQDTPEEDTFIKINSVLTHEILGKYWEKFQGQAGYEDFAALYKQPVEAFIMVPGKETNLPIYNQLPAEERLQTLSTLQQTAVSKINAPRTISFTLQGVSGDLIATEVREVKAGATVFEVFRTALQEAGYSYTAKGSYVQSITDPYGNTLAEFSHGENSGWMYRVNGSLPGNYMNSYYLEDGDDIIVLYTTNYLYESGSSWTSTTTNGLLTVSKTEHGTVTVDPQSPEKNATVTITVKPDKGYALDSLTVTDSQNNTIPVKEKENGTYTFTMPDRAITVKVSFQKIDEESAELSFLDVKDTDWFYEGIKYVYEKGIMKGTSETTFGANDTTTRGMIVTILYRLENEPQTNGGKFTDVEDGAYYTNAINWAAANGIVNGYTETTFQPNDMITREQLAAILFRYAAYKGYNITTKLDLEHYPDIANISDYAKETMEWAVGTKLLNGTDSAQGTVLEPQAKATRGQVAVIFMRLEENIAQ